MKKVTKPNKVKVIAVEQQPKPFWESTTVLLNLLALTPLALEVITSTNLIPDKDIYAIVVALLNIANRFRSQQPIKVH